MLFFDPNTFFLLPPLWHIGLILLFVLSVEALYRRHEYWSLPALAVYGTTWFWYYPDLNTRWSEYARVFSPGEMDLALGQAILFLATFRFILPPICRWCQGSEATDSKVPTFQNASLIFTILATLWILLLVVGVLTHGKGIFHALFPIGSRSQWSFMFGRGRIGGQWDWLISIAGYTYKIVVMLLGFSLFLPKKPTMQALNVMIVAISLPFFVFTGTRTGLLEVTAPIALGLFFLSRLPMATKLAALGWFLILMNTVMIIMVQYRNVGFGSLLDSSMEDQAADVDFHDGANMLEEMMWINVYLQDGSLRMAYGYNYMALLTQMVPRPIWPNKPTPGDQFSILRGFTVRGGGEGAAGSVATGFIGQGMWEFGSLLGPLSVAFIFALYCGWITRLWVQDHSLFRSFLALAALVFIFNLGRGITLLAAWPLVFGYVLIRAIELLLYYSKYESRQRIVLAQDLGEQSGSVVVPAVESLST